MKLNLRSIVACLVLILAGAAIAAPLARSFAQDGSGAAGAPNIVVGSAFTYQGRLDQDGVPANGNYDFRFTLHSDAAVNAPVGTPSVLTVNGVVVTNGLFSTLLDFGAGAFDGNDAGDKCGGPLLHG